MTASSYILMTMNLRYLGFHGWLLVVVATLVVPENQCGVASLSQPTPRVWPPRRERFLQRYDEQYFGSNNSATTTADDASSSWPFTAADMRREDETDDADFYAEPKFARHVDEWALASLKRYYGEELAAQQKIKQQLSPDDKEGGGDTLVRILDLCSSWMSHLPDNSAASGRKDIGRHIVGVGMNAGELEANPVLDAWHVQDLNRNPQLAMCASDSVDMVLLTCSVDYLIHPQTVFAEIHRVLRPGTGVALVSFSNRYFRSKAVRAWLLANDEGRRHIVASYFYYAVAAGGTSAWSSIQGLDVQMPKLTPAVVWQDFVLHPDAIQRWLGGAILRDTFTPDPLFVVKAVKK